MVDAIIYFAYMRQLSLEKFNFIFQGYIAPEKNKLLESFVITDIAKVLPRKGSQFSKNWSAKK